jgi:hypothetical protein
VERLREIEQIFQEALRRVPAERAAFVREACHGDTELQREVGPRARERACWAGIQSHLVREPQQFERKLHCRYSALRP